MKGTNSRQVPKASTISNETVTYLRHYIITKYYVKSRTKFKGTAPHDTDDEWFWGGEGKPGHLGRVVLHTAPEGSDFARDMKAFVEYVKTHPDAFQRYNDVKVEGAKLMLTSSEEDGRLIGYKMKKRDVCNQIKKEAIEWWTKKNGETDENQG